MRRKTGYHKLREGKPRCQECGHFIATHRDSAGPCSGVVGCGCKRFISRKKAEQARRKLKELLAAKPLTRSQQNASASCYWRPCPGCGNTVPIIKAVGGACAGFKRFHEAGCPEAGR